MTLGKAILVLENEKRVAIVNDHTLSVRALQLGIEALKVIHEHRSANFPWATPMLPGETKE